MYVLIDIINNIRFLLTSNHYFDFHSNNLKSLIIVFLSAVVTACASNFKGNNEDVSVVISGRTQQQIISDITSVVKNYKYSIFSESDDEVVFETHPETSNIANYIKYEQNHKRNKYSGFRNRKVKLPHYQIIFRFNKVKSGILVQANVKYNDWQHKNDVNVNYREGVVVQKILNELKINSTLESSEVLYSSYRTVFQFLERKLANYPPNESQQRVTYTRKVVMSHVDKKRQLTALNYVRKQLKNYCNFNNGILLESKSPPSYTAKGLSLSKNLFESIEKAGTLKAFGVKNCMRFGRTVWQLIIQAKSIDAANIPQIQNNPDNNRFQNPEIYLVINVLK